MGKKRDGLVMRCLTGCGNLYISIYPDDQEILIHVGKAGGCITAYLEAMAQLTTMLLKQGVAAEEIAKTLKGLRCQFPAWIEKDGGKSEMICSCPDAFAIFLRENKEYLEKVFAPREEKETKPKE